VAYFLGHPVEIEKMGYKNSPICSFCEL